MVNCSSTCGYRVSAARSSSLRLSISICSAFLGSTAIKLTGLDIEVSTMPACFNLSSTLYVVVLFIFSADESELALAFPSRASLTYACASMSSRPNAFRSPTSGSSAIAL